MLPLRLRAARLARTLTALLLHLLQELVGHLQVLLRGPLSLLNHLLQLRAGVVLEDLQRVERLHMMENLLAQERFVELSLLGVLKSFLRALQALLGELLLDAHPAAPLLPALSLAARLTALGLLPLQFLLLLLQLAAFLLDFLPLLPLLLLPLLLLSTLLPLLASERAAHLASGGLLQLLDELLVILRNPLRELLHLLILGLLLRELRQLDLRLIVDDQGLCELLV